MTAIDKRLTAAGLAVTVTELVDIWAEHCPPHLPVPDTCPGCGHTYTIDAPLCPTAAIVRPLIQRRRHEGRDTKTRFQRLTFNQHRDLFDKHLSTATACLIKGRVADTTTPGHQALGLFDITPTRRRGGDRR